MKTLYSLSTTDENAFNRLVRASAGLGPFTMTVSALPLVGRNAPGLPGGMFGTTSRPRASQERADNMRIETPDVGAHTRNPFLDEAKRYDAFLATLREVVNQARPPERTWRDWAFITAGTMLSQMLAIGAGWLLHAWWVQ